MTQVGRWIGGIGGMGSGLGAMGRGLDGGL